MEPSLPNQIKRQGQCGGIKSPKTILHGRDAILRVRDKLLISNTILQLWADVKYHVPTGFDFSPKASGFYPFDDATALAGESGVGDVAWLIQASASNHKPKGRFFWYAFGIYKPKEPSLWFEVDIIRVPELREKLTISTSIYECKPLFGFRNDIIRDEQGEPCYVSYSMGAFIDLQTAKLSPLPQEMIDSLTMDEKYPMEYCDRRVRLPKVEPTVCAPVVVTRDDIDYNHHMNNCCYIRIAQELIPSDFIIKRVRVEYKVAARQGEELTPLVYVDDNKYYIELKCERGTCAVIAFE